MAVAEVLEPEGRPGPKSSWPEYRTWCGMISRCHSQSGLRNPHYGGRGIRVCDEWRGPGGFERFYEHIGPKPSPKSEIDRYPDNDGNYEPGNVRWATRRQNLLNGSPSIEKRARREMRADRAKIISVPEYELRPKRAQSSRADFVFQSNLLETWKRTGSLYGGLATACLESGVMEDLVEVFGPTRCEPQRAADYEPEGATLLPEEEEEDEAERATCIRPQTGMTLEEVAKVLRVSRERVRQIQERALKKLRAALLAEVPMAARAAFAGDLRLAYLGEFS